VEAGENISFTGGDAAFFKLRGNFATNAGGDVHMKAGGKAVIEAPGGVTLKCGGSFITLNTSGVFIKGTAVNINSGGEPLSGPGDQAAKPEEPIEALNEEAGEISPPRRERSHQPTPTELDSHPQRCGVRCPLL